MSTSISLPLDDGFLRRECPHCERQFKWHHGSTPSRPEGSPDPEVYFCPYCGDTATHDQWWTTEQAEYAKHFALQEGLDQLQQSFEDLERRSRGEIVSFRFSRADAGEPPSPLHEASDMIKVEPPCHPWEPIKVDEHWGEAIHCLLCGASFALD